MTQSCPQLCIFLGFGVNHGFQAHQFRQFGRTDFDQIRLLISIVMRTRIGSQMAIANGLGRGYSRRRGRICNYIEKEERTLVWLLVIKTNSHACKSFAHAKSAAALLHLFPLIADTFSGGKTTKKSDYIGVKILYCVSPLKYRITR